MLEVLKPCNLHQLMCVMLFVGELKTLMALDREQQAVYHLQVKATDGGGRFCQANIILTLEDVNDNAPEFTSDTYSITVFENTEPKTLLTRVQAADADAGMHSLTDTFVMFSDLQYYFLSFILRSVKCFSSADRCSIPFRIRLWKDIFWSTKSFNI